jgi:hypothetical protein
MPSTIITKNGSGAPLAADLVAGELAVDLTNGRLYTEDTGGSVIEIGLNPSGNVDVTGTVTADGLTVDNTSAANIYLDGTGTGRARVHSTYGILNLTADADSDTAGTSIKFKSGTTDRMLIDSDTGDISFYEDTGTTAKLFWDASAESLGIGTVSPTSGYIFDARGWGSFQHPTGDSLVKIQTGNNTGTSLLYFSDSDSVFSGSIAYLHTDDAMRFNTAAAERLRIDSSGNVGIGTTDPTVASGHGLAIYDATVPRVQLRNSTSGDTSSDGAGIFMSGSDLGIENRESSNIIFYNNTEKMRIDSAGNLLVGTTDSQPAANNDANGISLRDAGTIEASRDAGPSGKFNRKTSDGSIIDFSKDGTTVGSIGSNSGTYMYAGTGDTGVLFNVDASGVQPWNTTTNANSDGLINLGFSGSRFKDLYLSGGVDISQGSSPQNAFLDFVKTINDDAVYSFTPDQDIGVLYIYARNSSYSFISGMVNYRKLSTAFCTKIFDQSSTLSTSTSVLTGTTGTDGLVTISAVSSDGKIYIENRSGFTISIGIHISGK